MPYTPDATNAAEPTDAQKASTMGLEFRTLKSYIQSVLLPLLAGKANPDGTNATGTWPINVIGTAASASTAGSATTAGTATNVAGAGTVSTTDIAVRQATPGFGFIRMQYGDAHSGYISFFNPAGTRIGWLGYGDAGGIGMTVENGGTWNSNVDIIAPNFRGNLIGSVPWTSIAGRPTSLSQFINDIGAGGGGGGGGTIVSFQGRTDTAAVLTGPDVVGALGYTPYNASNPAGFTTIAGVAAAGFQTSSGAVASATSANTAINTNGGFVNATFGNFAGLVKGNGGGVGLGAITVSAADPSGGSDGDIWFKV